MEKDKMDEARAAALRKVGKIETKKFSRKVAGPVNGIPLPEVPHSLISVNDGAEKPPVCIIQGQTVVCVGRWFNGIVTIEYVTPDVYAAHQLKLATLITEELEK